MKELKKLIDVKSIVTIILVIALVVIATCNITITDETIKTLFVSTLTSCFTYFFTKKKDSEV